MILAAVAVETPILSPTKRSTFLAFPPLERNLVASDTASLPSTNHGLVVCDVGRRRVAAIAEPAPTKRLNTTAIARERLIMETPSRSRRGSFPLSDQTCSRVRCPPGGDDSTRRGISDGLALPPRVSRAPIPDEDSWAGSRPHPPNGSRPVLARGCGYEKGSMRTEAMSVRPIRDAWWRVKIDRGNLVGHSGQKQTEATVL